MSKFTDGIFYGGYDTYAVSKEVFTREQAIYMARIEFESVKEDPCYIRMGEAYVRHRAGWNEDGERCVGWFLEYEYHGTRSVPVWCFGRHQKGAKLHAGYELIEIKRFVSENITCRCCRWHSYDGLFCENPKSKYYGMFRNDWKSCIAFERGEQQ